MTTTDCIGGVRCKKNTTLIQSERQHKKMCILPLAGNTFFVSTCESVLHLFCRAPFDEFLLSSQCSFTTLGCVYWVMCAHFIYHRVGGCTGHCTKGVLVTRGIFLYFAIPMQFIEMHNRRDYCQMNHLVLKCFSLKSIWQRPRKTPPLKLTSMLIGISLIRILVFYKIFF